MIVHSAATGLVLAFKSANEIRNVIIALSRLAELAEKDGRPPPFLYSLYPKESTGEMEKMIKYLKGAGTT